MFILNDKYRNQKLFITKKLIMSVMIKKTIV